MFFVPCHQVWAKRSDGARDKWEGCASPISWPTFTNLNFPTSRPLEKPEDISKSSNPQSLGNGSLRDIRQQTISIDPILRHMPSMQVRYPCLSPFYPFFSYPGAREVRRVHRSQTQGKPQARSWVYDKVRCISQYPRCDVKQKSLECCFLREIAGVIILPTQTRHYYMDFHKTIGNLMTPALLSSFLTYSV